MERTSARAHTRAHTHLGTDMQAETPGLKDYAELLNTQPKMYSYMHTCARMHQAETNQKHKYTSGSRICRVRTQRSASAVIYTSLERRESANK